MPPSSPAARSSTWPVEPRRQLLVTGLVGAADNGSVGQRDRHIGTGQRSRSEQQLWRASGGEDRAGVDIEDAPAPVTQYAEFGDGGNTHAFAANRLDRIPPNFAHAQITHRESVAAFHGSAGRSEGRAGSGRGTSRTE